MKRKTEDIWKKAGILVIAAILIVVAFTGNVNAIQLNKHTTIVSRQMTSEIFSGHDYQILWSVDWLDGDVSDTEGGKVAIDSNNNITTYGYSGALDQHIILKYDIDGNQLWQVPVDTDGLNYIESVDLELYIEGGYTGTDEIPDGRTGINNDDGYFIIWSIATDQDDNIILVCEKYVVNPEPPHNFYVVAFKYDSNGNEIWKNAYDYNGLLFPGYDSVVSSDGSIFIPCSNYVWSYVLKLNPDGSVDWFEVTQLMPSIMWPLSIVLDSNENPIIACENWALGEIYPDTLFLELTKFDGTTGNKLAASQLTAPIRGNVYVDAALAIDTSDNSIFLGLMDYIYKIDESFSQIIWAKYYAYPIHDLKVVDEKLIACGGWCHVNDILNYYAAVYDKNSGSKLLDMALGELLYCDDPFFQPYHNNLKGMAVDNHGDILFAGGQGGMRTVKVRITESIVPNELLQYISYRYEVST